MRRENRGNKEITKNYQSPALDVIRLDMIDIITISGIDGPGGGSSGSNGNTDFNGSAVTNGNTWSIFG